MKGFIKRLVRTAGYELHRAGPEQSEKDLNPDVTPEEWEIYSIVKPYTMLSLERILANIRAIDYIETNGIRGDVVECGVWRGGSAMAMALRLNRRYNSTRTLWMYDTFEGMTPPTDADRANDGTSAGTLLDSAREHEMAERSLVIAYASIEDVSTNLGRTNYKHCRFIKGPVEKTIPGEMSDHIALLRLDTDWYESTRHELVHLYPRLAPGGILIIDDYGHWQGARRAVDEFLEGQTLFLNRVDYTARLAVKPLTAGQS